MPNHKSAAKRQRQNKVRNERNVAYRSRMRTAIKQARVAIETAADDRQEKVQHAVNIVQKARSRNIIHPSTASRTVSRLMKASFNTVSP